jgi:15-cis-phytoene synthase/lycopene beta-cyclase
LTIADRTVFYTFSSLIPRLVPIHPFLELCHGYETDLRFANKTTPPEQALQHNMPIVTQGHLLDYADDVAGSVASACCYLAWSILTPATNEANRLQPRAEYADWAGRLKTTLDGEEPDYSLQKPTQKIAKDRVEILSDAREMGWALQLVNIARDMKKDALLNRIYIPLASFPDNEAILSFLHPQPGKLAPSTRPYVLDLLQVAFSLRQKTAASMELLPREARGGLRAMVASYFEIAEEVIRRDGEVEETGVKVSSWRRLRAASSAMWGLAA